MCHILIIVLYIKNFKYIWLRHLYLDEKINIIINIIKSQTNTSYFKNYVVLNMKS